MIVRVIVVVCVPSTKSSSTPVTVTVWAVSQFADVKVNELVTVASPVSAEVMSITTSDVGSASKTTVKVSVDPVSATVVDPLDSATVNPAVSLSAFEILTV